MWLKLELPTVSSFMDELESNFSFYYNKIQEDLMPLGCGKIAIR